MICPQCRAPNNEGDKFCEQCGSPLPLAAASSPMLPDDASLGATVLAGPSAPSILVRLGGPSDELYRLESRAIIGRLDSCDIPINDKSVSREHARLSRLRDGYVIEDLGSTNGTLVNGVRISEAVLLRPGDLVTVGSIEFRYELEGDHMHASGDELAGGSTMVMASPPADRGRGFEFEQHTEPKPEHDDVPTMQDIPPVAVSFPPLEPFSAAEEPEPQPSAREEAPAPPPFFPPDDFRTPASPGFEMDLPPRHDFPPLSSFEKPPEAAPELPAPEAIPEIPLQPEPEPIVDDPKRWTFEPANIPAALPHQEAKSVGSQPSGVTSGTTDDAVALADQLQAAVHDLAQQFQEREEAMTRTQQRLNDLGLIEQRQKMLRSILQDVPERSMTVQQLQSVQDMLDTLIQSPRDASILIQLGEQAAGLAAVVNEYGKLRRILRRAGGEVDVPVVE